MADLVPQSTAFQGGSVGPTHEGVPLAASPLERILRIATATSLGALGISLMVHVLGGLIAAVLVVGAAPGRGEGSGGDAPVEMAILSQAELTQLQDAAMGLSTPSVTDVGVETDIPAAIEEIAGAGEALGGDMGDVGALAGGGDIGGSGEGLGGSGGGGGGRFFGVEVQGNRFAYIVDISGSMDGPRLAFLREELNQSIGGLLETSEFVIIQFSDDAKVVGEQKGWQQATTAVKRTMKNEIALLAAMGGTNPLPGFQVASTVRPRPDAIYFMTDGDFADQTADEIVALWQGAKVPVHTICFGSRDGEDRMKKIARQTRGTYTYVKGP
jgi:hypothetical protein